ncbi:hypothetical protein D3C87_1499340 [compost metagenome]
MAKFTRLVVSPIDGISAVAKTRLKHGDMVLRTRNCPVQPIAATTLILWIFAATLGKQSGKIIIVNIAIRMLLMPPTREVAKGLMRLLIANTCQTCVYIETKKLSVPHPQNIFMSDQSFLEPDGRNIGKLQTNGGIAGTVTILVRLHHTDFS